MGHLFSLGMDALVSGAVCFTTFNVTAPLSTPSAEPWHSISGRGEKRDNADIHKKSDTQNSVSRVALMSGYRAAAVASSTKNYDASAAGSVTAGASIAGSAAGAASIAGSSTTTGAIGVAFSPVQPIAHMHARTARRAIGLTRETKFIVFNFSMGLNKPEPRTANREPFVPHSRNGFEVPRDVKSRVAPRS